MRNIIFVAMFVLFLTSFVSADSFKQNDDIEIRHPIRIDGATNSNILANITIKDSDNLVLVNFKEMTFDSEAEEHNFTLVNTSKIGTYNYCITATGSGLNDTSCFILEVTPSGFDRINSGEGLSLAVAIIAMIFVSLLFFLMFNKTENIVLKTTFLSLTVIILFMSILFITVSVQQNLGGFENIIDGYETFLFVLKSLMTLAFLVFMIFVMLVVVKAWRIKRGLVDMD